MGRLLKQVLADATTDNLLIKFKKLVPLEQISSKIKDLYFLWVKATYGEENNMDYFSQWFDDYYDSVLPDCINNAKENDEFNEKYNNLTSEELDELNSQIIEFINVNKDVVEHDISQSQDDTSDLPLDNPKASDIYNINEYNQNDGSHDTLLSSDEEQSNKVHDATTDDMVDFDLDDEADFDLDDDKTLIHKDKQKKTNVTVQ